MSKKIKNLATFSIGLNGSPDLYHADNVAKFLNTNHTIVLVNETQMLDAIERTIYQIESYDITTIRASVPMLLLSEYIIILYLSDVVCCRKKRRANRNIAPGVWRHPITWFGAIQSPSVA